MKVDIGRSFWGAGIAVVIAASALLALPVALAAEPPPTVPADPSVAQYIETIPTAKGPVPSSQAPEPGPSPAPAWDTQPSSGGAEQPGGDRSDDGTASPADAVPREQATSADPVGAAIHAATGESRRGPIAAVLVGLLAAAALAAFAIRRRGRSETRLKRVR